jgi:hypothetical protein
MIFLELQATRYIEILSAKDASHHSFTLGGLARLSCDMVSQSVSMCKDTE